MIQELAVATFSGRVGATSELYTDDANQTYTGTMYLGSVQAVVGWLGSWAHAGFRFTGVSGLSGSTITVANLTFTADANDTGPMSATMYGEDALAPATFVDNANNITGRDRTTASVAAGSAEVGSWTDESTYTLDVRDIIQEIAGKHDPAALVLLWIYSSGTGERVCYAYDAYAGKAALLELTYTAAGGDGTITAAGAATADADCLVVEFKGDGKLVAEVCTADADCLVASITSTAAGTIQAGLCTATADCLEVTFTADGKLAAEVCTADADCPTAQFFSTTAPEWTGYPRHRFRVVREDLPSNATFYLEVIMTTDNAANEARMRLWNVSDSAKVAGSDVASIILEDSEEPSLSGPFDFHAGTNTYEIQSSGDVGGAYIWHMAQVLVDW